jgi:hypothetical protein
VLFAFLPSCLRATMATIETSATISAYSTRAC